MSEAIVEVREMIAFAIQEKERRERHAQNEMMIPPWNRQYKCIYFFLQTMDELLTIVRLCRPKTRAERATIRESARVIRERLHFAERQRERLVAEALLLLHGVSDTRERSRT